MYNKYCLICNDKNNAKIQLHEMQNIITQIERIIGAYDPCIRVDRNNLPAAYIYNERKSFHFMCGRCPEFRKSDLEQKEKKMHDLLYLFCLRIQSGQVSTAQFCKVLNLLRGHYPNAYKILHAVKGKQENKKV